MPWEIHLRSRISASTFYRQNTALAKLRVKDFHASFDAMRRF
jgi:hypothetical protein